MLAVGVDEQRSRLVLVSGEHDARIAVLAQADIQAAVTPLRVITARPIAVNLSKLAVAAIEAMGSPLITSNVLTMYQDQEKPALVMQFLEPFIEQLAWMHKVVNLANLDGLAQTFQIAQ